MRTLPPFFILGTVGMLVTSALHMAMALFLVGPSVHGVFFSVYPVFLAFLVIGTAQLVKHGGTREA